MAAVNGSPLLTLVCDGHRAQADSSLRQRGHLSLIKDLTQTAKVICRNVACLVDGAHDAVYEGRGSYRDVYRIGEGLIMKLIDRARENASKSNAREVAALRATVNLASTSALFYHGPRNMQTKQYRGTRDSVTSAAVNYVPKTYGGPFLKS